MAKKTAYKPQGFESKGIYLDSMGKPHKDTSAMIFESMLRSPALEAITYKQFMLYVVCKAQLYGKRKPAQDFKNTDLFQEEDCFYLSWKDISNYPRLYGRNGNSDFRKDLEALIAAGLIERISSGKTHRTKSIYKFSSVWKEKEKA